MSIIQFFLQILGQNELKSQQTHLNKPKIAFWKYMLVMPKFSKIYDFQIWRQGFCISILTKNVWNFCGLQEFHKSCLYSFLLLSNTMKIINLLRKTHPDLFYLGFCWSSCIRVLGYLTQYCVYVYYSIFSANTWPKWTQITTNTPK